MTQPTSPRRFTPEDIAEAVRLTAEEHPGRRVLLAVSTAHWTLALRQNIVLLIVSGLTMLALYETALLEGAAAPDALAQWSRWTLANIMVRAMLTARLFSANSPAVVVRSIGFRLIPVFIAALAIVQWAWTIHLFVGSSASTTLLVFVGLTGTSVVVISLWATSPLAPALFVTVTWAAFVNRAFQSSVLPTPALAALVLVIALLLWACAYLHVQQVRGVLDRSDQVDLLLEGLRKTNAELQQANDALSGLRAKAAQELETRTLFFNSASHDFRQRLHAMKLLANSALQGQVDYPKRPALQRLVHSVEDVEAYINDVLDFARTDRFGGLPARRRVRVQALLQSLEVGFADVAEASGIALALRPTKVELSTDPALLQRILENLVSNALKSSTRKVLVATRRRHAKVVLQVWDQGTGIDAGGLPSIFEPFRTAATRRPGQTGAGLGMAIVKRFADCLGYSIEIASRPGKGTVVSVVVPADDVCASRGSDAGVIAAG